MDYNIKNIKNMKFNTLKIKHTALLLFVSMIGLAQGPDPDVPLPGDTNPTDAPLDTNLIWFIAIAVFFVAYKFYSKKQIAE